MIKSFLKKQDGQEVIKDILTKLEGDESYSADGYTYFLKESVAESQFLESDTHYEYKGEINLIDGRVYRRYITS